MKIFLALALTAAVGPVLAGSPFGATATVTGVKCVTVDLKMDDGLAPYATFLAGEHFGVQGKVIGQEGQESYFNSKSGPRMASPYLNISKRAASGTAQVVADRTGNAGMMTASAITAPDRFYDAFEFKARDYPDIKLGPYSAVECSGSYVVTAWANTNAKAPGSAGSMAYVTWGQAGSGRGSDHVDAFVNPAKGPAYAQKSGTFTFRYANDTSNEAVVFGGIEAWVSGGQVTANP
jgi:hypothetical protein